MLPLRIHFSTYINENFHAPSHQETDHILPRNVLIKTTSAAQLYSGIVVISVDVSGYGCV